MKIQILLISDIHGNYPALQAVADLTNGLKFDHIINSGDCLVYAPFPDETIGWLRKNKAISIRGNTDKRVAKLIGGKDFKKPQDYDKRIMYSTTAVALSKKNREFLLQLKDSATLTVKAKNGGKYEIGIFHGSPSDPKEFLFADTPDERFQQLAQETDCDIIVTGHSHTPYVKYIGGKYFINPGSVGRIFDGDPRGCFAILSITNDGVHVHHIRCSYDIDAVINQIEALELPEIYCEMFRTGQKLN